MNPKFYRKKTRIVVIGRGDNGSYIVHNEDNPTDVWTIPKDVFEGTYEKVVE
jgi:hypothetical protein